MAYAAGDGFLPSWGPGMKPLEPHDRPSSNGSLKKNAKTKSAEYDTYGSFSQPKKGYEKTFLRDEELPLYNPEFGYISGGGNARNGMMAPPKPNDGAKTACLFLLPLISGLIILNLCNFWWWKHEHLCIGVFSLFVLVGLVMCIIGLRGGLPARQGSGVGGYSATFCGVTGGTTIFVSSLGLLFGIVGYCSYLRSYHIYTASRTYDMVSPSAHPNQFKDGGVMSFTDDAHVDTYKGAAYRKDVTWCAAPIVGNAPASNVGFWAVGIDCCGAGYFKCGGVYDQHAHGGLLVLDANPHFHKEIPMYMKAAEESAARAGLALPPNPMFLHWTSAVDAGINNYKKEATTFALEASLGLLFVVVLVVAGLVATKPKSVTGRGGLADRFYCSSAPDPDAFDPTEGTNNIPGRLWSPEFAPTEGTRFTGHGERLSRDPLMANDAMQTRSREASPIRAF
jgi:hypothetical protein